MKDEKILQDELMIDDELDNVVGGSQQELNDVYNGMTKSHFLSVGLKKSSPGSIDINEVSDILKEKFGIELYYNAHGKNLYKDGRGENVPHDKIVDLCTNYDRYLAYATGS